MAQSYEHIVWLHFNEARPDGKQDYFFSSLMAVFDVFSREDIGATYRTAGCKGLPYSNSKCSITRHEFIVHKRK